MFFLLSLSVCLSLPPSSSLFFPLALHRIKVIPETNHNTLFVSFSDDSTTKVWDMNKMEGLHVINKPKLVYNQQGKRERDVHVHICILISLEGKIKTGCYCMGN